MAAHHRGSRRPRAGEATIGEATIDKIRSDPGNAWPPDIHIQGGREMLEQFVGSSWLDESLGPLLDEIGRDPQRAANTLTIVTADHGAGSTGKGGVYEGGVRVPLLLHWPARPPIEASVLRGAHYLTHLDLLPTLASLAGVPALTTSTSRSFATRSSVGGTCRVCCGQAPRDPRGEVMRR